MRRIAIVAACVRLRMLSRRITPVMKTLPVPQHRKLGWRDDRLRNTSAAIWSNIYARSNMVATAAVFSREGGSPVWVPAFAGKQGFYTAGDSRPQDRVDD